MAPQTIVLTAVQRETDLDGRPGQSKKLMLQMQMSPQAAASSRVSKSVNSTPLAQVEARVHSFREKK